MHRFIVAIVVVLSCVLNACHVYRAPLKPGLGRSTFEMVANAASSAPRSQPIIEKSEETVRVISELPFLGGDPPMPDYPPAVIQTKGMDKTFFVTVLISDTRAVESVAPSVFHFSPVERWDELYLDSIRAAVARWRFEPGHRIFWQRNPGQEDSYLRTKKTAASVELKFTFSKTGSVQ